MKQCTQFLTCKISRFWLHSFLGFSTFLSYALVTSSVGKNAMAQAGVDIMIDPYNNTNVGSLSIEPSSVKTSPSSNNKSLPMSNQNERLGEIFIKGHPTPPPPIITSGNLIKSNQTLPQIPSLSEPYRKPDNDNVNNQNFTNNENITTQTNNTSLSVSLSPFDKTPSVNQPSFSSKESKEIINPVNNINTTAININVSPKSSASVNNSAINTENINTSSSQTTLGSRRNLNDILVFSAPSNNNSNNSSVIPTTTTNQRTSIVTKSNIHKVLVKVHNANQESQVKSLYPGAFKTNLRGESMLQVGVFSNVETALEISNSLKKMGLNTFTIGN